MVEPENFQKESITEVSLVELLNILNTLMYAHIFINLFINLSTINKV